jgi:RNA polymerase sigma-70 factor (ECF subfamily)
MQTASDEVLIGRIANGDRLAMQVLFARHHVRVYRFILRLVRNDATAEDLVSEVFLDVWRQAG